MKVIYKVVFAVHKDSPWRSIKFQGSDSKSVLWNINEWARDNGYTVLQIINESKAWWVVNEENK